MSILVLSFYPRADRAPISKPSTTDATISGPGSHATVISGQRLVDLVIFGLALLTAQVCGTISTRPGQTPQADVRLALFPLYLSFIVPVVFLRS